MLIQKPEQKVKELEQKAAALEGQVQEQPKITFDYGVLESSRFYITTDKSFYEKMIKNPKVIPMFTPEAMVKLKTKEIHQLSQDFYFYVFRIPEDK